MRGCAALLALALCGAGLATAAGTGSTSVARLPPRRTDTIDVTDRLTQRLDTVRCNVANAQK
jgi:hypothetical protein